jgi:GNAT superfamily N-acetyltransferase
MPNDAAGIAQVHVAAWRSAYRGIVAQSYLDALDVAAREQNWTEWLSRTGPDVVGIYVAEISGSVVGFISGGALREAVGDCDCEIYAIYVLEQAQQRGIGRALMSRMATELAAQGFARPAVWVLAQNPACRFYARLGARPMAEKQIEIGGAQLTELAYGWNQRNALLGEDIPADAG